jgi:acyl-CoA thioester hydrolase
MGKTYTCEIEVRWADFDQLGHVNNVKYLEYAQEARIRFFAACLHEAFGRRESRMVIRRTEIEYLRPYDDLTEPLYIDIELSHIGRTSYTVRHRMHNTSGVVFATADSVMVNFDPRTGTSVPLSGTERAALADYLVEEPVH